MYNLPQSVEEIREDFQFMENWEERFRYIVDLGKQLPPLPEEKKIDDHLVPGCMSRAWLILTFDREQQSITFEADSEAYVVRGLVALLFIIYFGKTPEEILEADINGLFHSLGLDKELTANRRNGFQSMVKKIHAFAQHSIANPL